MGFLILKIELDVILAVFRYFGNWVNDEDRLCGVCFPAFSESRYLS